MASRPELIEMMKELFIEYRNQSIEEMTQLIRKKADYRFNKTHRVSQYRVSDTLRKFLTEEYDYILVDEDGNTYDYKGNLIEKSRRKKRRQNA